MKKLIYFAACCIFAVILSCKEKTNTTPDNNNTPLTTIALTEKEYSFGEIFIQDSVIHRFGIKNIGKNPLHIKNVESSCGCTTPEWSKEPIAPGNSGFVTVKFKPNGTGTISKSVMLETNTADPFQILYLKGTVKDSI